MFVCLRGLRVQVERRCKGDLRWLSHRKKKREPMTIDYITEAIDIDIGALASAFGKPSIFPTSHSCHIIQGPYSWLYIVEQLKRQNMGL